MILLAAFLSLATVLQLPRLFRDFVRLFYAVTGKLDGYQVGEVIGAFLFWTVYFLVIFFLWKYGIRLVKKQQQFAEWNPGEE